MKLRLTARAHRDLVNIAEFIEEDDPAAAARVVGRIEATLNLISEMPKLGRPSARTGTRESPVRGLPLLVVYRLAPGEIEILTIFHTSRDPDDR